MFVWHFLQWLWKALLRFCVGPPPRGSVVLQHIEEIQIMAQGFRYTFAVPPPAAEDVVKTKVKHTSDGKSKDFEIDPTAATLQVEAVQGTDNVLELVDVDDAGNDSTPSVFSWLAIDTVPPPARGQLGILQTEEIDIPDEVPPQE